MQRAQAGKRGESSLQRHAIGKEEDAERRRVRMQGAIFGA
jgi:hypothetical protein